MLRVDPACVIVDPYPKKPSEGHMAELCNRSHKKENKAIKMDMLFSRESLKMSDTIKIFAYGSLINQNSLRKTAPSANAIVPAKVYGFERSFCLPSSHRRDKQSNDPVCVLNLENGLANACINGICFDIETHEFDALAYREKGYQLHQITAHHFDTGDKIPDANVFMATDYEPYAFLPDSEAQNHYVQLCLNGCKVFGDAFVQHFKETTGFFGIENYGAAATVWNGGY